MYKILLSEPKWAENILITLNSRVNSHEILKIMIPFSADVFVFSYPIFLVVLYLYGIFYKKIEYKIASLYIFFAGSFSVVVNLIIQQFIYKQRPEQLALAKENLIFSHVPDSPFPSDHAAISAAI